MNCQWGETRVRIRKFDEESEKTRWKGRVKKRNGSWREKEKLESRRESRKRGCGSSREIMKK